MTVDSTETIFDDGASFATLSADDVLEVSGFPDGSGVQATRVSLRGTFPADDDVDLIGAVANLVVNPDDSVCSISVRSRFASRRPRHSRMSRAPLMNGDWVKVGRSCLGHRGRPTEVELEGDGLEVDDLARIEIEGVRELPTVAGLLCWRRPGGHLHGDVRAGDLRADDRGSRGGEAAGLGTLEATEVESEEKVRTSATFGSKPQSRTSIQERGRWWCGAAIAADGETILEDDSSVGDESFMFGEIQVGDFVEVRGRRRLSERTSALDHTRRRGSGADNVRLEGR